MSIVVIEYEAKCKHCSNCSIRTKQGKKKQAYCAAKNEWIRQNDKACDEFKL